MFTTTCTKPVNNVMAKIVQKSKYPIPWNGSKNDRPGDYFEQIETQIYYIEHENKVEISIPAVEKSEENRRRKIKVRVNGQEYPFNSAGLAILDMSQTFDLPEMQKLVTLAAHAQKSPNDNSVMRACLPFYYTKMANYRLPAEKRQYVDNNGDLLKTHGNIKQLVAPYIKAMTAHSGKIRELYIPVATLGNPHHWNVCILTINEQNLPSLTYLESSPAALGDFVYLNFYKKYIVPKINSILKQNGYKIIDSDDLILYASKQFSLRGCGIAASINIENLVNGRLKIKKDSSHSYPALTLEEDAVRRVQLALQARQHNMYISQWRTFCSEHEHISPKIHAKQEAVLRELTTHPRCLKRKALEVFPPPSDQIDSSQVSILDQIREKIRAKKKWHFDGLVGYSRYVANDRKTSIPQGVRKILNILNSKFLDEEKIQAIQEIVKNRKGVRFASIVGLGLFMRSDDTKQCYAEIFKIISSRVKTHGHGKGI
jgi:hypothetical protein